MQFFYLIITIETIFAAPIQDNFKTSDLETAESETPEIEKLRIVPALLFIAILATALFSFCDCPISKPQKTQTKQFSYSKQRTNLEDAEYFASFSKNSGNIVKVEKNDGRIVRLQNIPIETVPMLKTHRTMR